MSKTPFNFFAGDAEKHANSGLNGSNGLASSQNPTPASIFQMHPPESTPIDNPLSQSNNLRASLMEAIRTISNSDPALTESLKQSILELLLSERPSTALEEDLFNALGIENFELISQIIEHREQVVQVLVDSSDSANEILNVTRESTPIDYEEDDTPMSNFIVQTKSQAKQRKEQRKDQKRAHREVTKVIAGLGETDKLEYQLALREHQKRM